MTRKSLGKKIRFDVFKRDRFTCAYCGQSPPVVTLEVDHVIAIAAGGTNDDINLITACYDCNRGKGARPLTEFPASAGDLAEAMQERRAQVLAFERLLRLEKRRTERNIDAVEAILITTPGWQFTDSFRRSIRMFLSHLPFNTVIDAAELAVSKMTEDGRSREKYFCGVCWRAIKGDRPPLRWQSKGKRHASA